MSVMYLLKRILFDIFSHKEREKQIHINDFCNVCSKSCPKNEEGKWASKFGNFR